MRLRIASWNIAGGHTIKSLEQFDYDVENIKYFSEELKKINPDIACLQEVEDDGKNSQIKNLCCEPERPHHFFLPSHKSHINKNAMMGNAILSKLHLTKMLNLKLPVPEWEMKWPNGQLVDKFEKQLLMAKIDGTVIANIQLEPLGLWGHNYFEGKGLELAHEIEKVLLKIPAPFILCGDFSGDFPQDNVASIFSELFSQHKLKDALPDEITRPSKEGGGRKTDHIFYTEHYKLINSGIVGTKTDHYLCFAEFEI